jgi:alpha-L-rhamnosidase
MKPSFHLIAVFLVAAMAFSCQSSMVQVTDLKTEGLVDPLGIDRTQPHLSWIMESPERGEIQTAYRILVASSRENLDNDLGDLWDSRKVASDASIAVPYAGATLNSGMEAFWKVKVWDAGGKASAWSPAAKWSMGILRPGDWNAKWIGLDKAIGTDRPDQQHRVLSARYLRKEFNLDKKVKRAMAYIVGLGTYELYLNGEKVGDQVLSPGLTDFPKRSFYITYDVTDMVREGNNTAGTILGNGRYFAPSTGVPTSTLTYGYPKMLLQIAVQYEDGSEETIVSDESWKITTDGPIISNNEYDGEFYDARKELPGWNQNGYDDSGWMQAELVDNPSAELSAQMTQPIRVTGTLKPVGLTNPEPGVWVFDMGQNMVGWTEIKVRAEEGTKITQRFAETLKEDGTLYLDNLRDARVTDTYIAKGHDVESYAPRFVYHGFRFVELTGYPVTPELSMLEGSVVNDDLPLVGSFECSNKLINQIYKNAYWGIRGNYRSIPTDCPQRDERQGWLGDRAAGSKGETYVFGVHNLYRKWLVDVFDSQRETGSISDVNPAYWPLYNDNVTWAGTPVILVKMLFDQYGDAEVIEKSYSSLKKWMDYMVQTYMVDDIMPRDNYGDWCVPPIDPKVIHTKNPDRLTDGDYIGTAYFCHMLELMEGFAALLGKADDESYFNELHSKMKAGFNKKFFNQETRIYSNNSATANILALAFNLVPEQYKEVVFNNLVEKIEVEHHSHITTGLIGQQFFNRTLTDHGRADLAFTVNTQMDYPSYGYMIENGATTIWELWNGNTADPAMNSGNHVMLLGDFLIWLYEDIAGISPDPQNPGFKHIIMKPTLIEGIDFVKATHKSPYGMIKSEWVKTPEDFDWQITIPANTTATIYIPVKEDPDILESGGAFAVKADKTHLGISEVTLASGSYHFISNLK